MKFLTYLIAILPLLFGVLAVDLRKNVIVYYPDSTPNSVVDEAKRVITEAGGTITHEYNLIKYAPSIASRRVGLLY